MAKYFDWSSDKNETLIRERGISFELVVVAIMEQRILAVLQNRLPKQHQKLLVVEIEGYAYVVPYVEDEETIFLKTVYPSRKPTKEYLHRDI